MKPINTSAFNSMSDSRLSGLSLLTIERDFAVDYQKIIDAFANCNRKRFNVLRLFLYIFKKARNGQRK
jgi:hypothetical protein